MREKPSTKSSRLRKLADLRASWARLVAAELLFLPGETSHSEGEMLTDAANVVRIATEFWEETLSRIS